MREEIIRAFKTIQQDICTGLEEADGRACFMADHWERPGGGGGESRVITGGKLFEKGGVNFSAVFGELPDAVVKEFGVSTSAFFATGVSLVIHPESPMIPIVHMNIRYFELPGDNLQWFGGGIDLTPHYVNEEEGRHFHRCLKQTCDHFHPEYYPRFKDWADRYFYIKHRKETRGIGGIFFDRLSGNGELDISRQFEFVKAVGNTFLPAYLPIVSANKDKTFTQEEKNWQLIRRSRYVEFNLVYDRGTHFGLQTEGRIESILMSLPPYASWPYNYQPVAGSREADALKYFQAPFRWA